jgi:hypothetical protein
VGHHGGVDEVDHPVGVERQEEPSRRRPLTLAVAIVVALVAFAWVSYWSQRTPEVLTGGSTVAFEPGPDRGPFQVGVIFPATSGSVDNVELVELRPVVARNTADAIIGFTVCTPKGEPVVSAVGTLDDICTRTRPAEQTTLQAAGEYVVMTIAPEHAGVVRVTEVEVTYRQGWQMLWLPRTVELGAGARVKVT